MQLLTIMVIRHFYYITKNGGNPALVRQKLAALDLKWETTQTLDFGIEGTLFDRLNFSLGYFDKRSKDLLFEVRFPIVSRFIL